MDNVATGAVTAAVHDTRKEFDRWFEIVKEQYDALEPDEDWDEFSRNFKSAAEAEQYSTEKVDYFLEYVAALESPMDVVGQLADVSEWPAALSTYQEVYELAEGTEGTEGTEGDGAVAEDEAAEEEAEEDETAFFAYLISEWNGRWDGREESWSEYADWVVY
ncbi:MAG: hypothetical protein ACREX8_17900, partial [Gammaproteobacteria bacterium]